MVHEKNSTEGRRLIRDSLINYTGIIVSGLVSILLVPILIKGLGTETYGLWIAALALVGLLMGVDLGLEWSIPRAIATSNEPNSEMLKFVATAANLYLLIGFCGAAIIGAAGLALAGNLHLSEENLRMGRTTFLLAGLIFLTNQPLKFANAVLSGLRRFDASNAIVIALVLTRAAGIIALLKAGGGLIAVASWYVIANTIVAIAALWIIGRLDVRYRFQPGRLSVASLRGHLRFSLTSQLIAAVTRVFWESAPLFIGIFRGSAAVVPYHIGQRLPFAVSIIHDRAGNVIFPSASRNAQNSESTRNLLISGMRWILMLAIPICVLLWILAPLILNLWLGSAPVETITIMRLTTAAVFFDAIGAASLHILWGRGSTLTILSVLCGMAAASILLGLFLLQRIGIVGMAWGFLIPMIVGSLFLLYSGARAASISVPLLAMNILNLRQDGK